MSYGEQLGLLQFLKVLGDGNRLRIIGLLSKNERNVGDLAQILELKEPTVSHHLSKLRSMGLVNLRVDGNQRYYRLNQGMLNRFKDMVLDIERLAGAEIEPKAGTAWLDDLPLDDEDKKIIKDYTENGKLKQIPAKQKKLLPILRWLILSFQSDRLYTEKEVNALIGQYHEDYATLRRDLVEFGFLRRERGGGKYWLTPVVDDHVV